MPKRMLRDWTDSETIDKLSAKAEMFYTRLIMKADDFGIYFANIKLLKANLYPLRDNMRPSDITPLLAECAEAGLLGTYTVAGKDYLVILNFGQRLRSSVSKLPEPPENQFVFKDGSYFLKNDRNPRTSVRNMPPEEEVEVEVEGETPQAAAPTHPPELVEAFKKFNNWLEQHAPRVLQLKTKISIEQFKKLKTKYPDMKTPAKTLKAMHNYKPLTKNYVDAYLTLTKWIQKDEQPS